VREEKNFSQKPKFFILLLFFRLRELNSSLFLFELRSGTNYKLVKEILK